MSDKKYTTKDNGTRLTYNTGAMKEQPSGKGRYDLLPPCAIKRLADIYERGASKYSERNWQKGIPLSRLVDSAIRHGFQYLEGMRDEDHAGAAAWNWIAVIYTETMIERGLLPPELNDLPNDFALPENMKELFVQSESSVAITAEQPGSLSEEIKIGDRVETQMALKGTVLAIEGFKTKVKLDMYPLGPYGDYHCDSLTKI